MFRPPVGNTFDVYLQTPEGLLSVVRQVFCCLIYHLNISLKLFKGTKFHEKTFVCHHASSVNCDTDTDTGHRDIKSLGVKKLSIQTAIADETLSKKVRN